MKRFLKWTAAIVLVIAAIGFLVFLYLIPPFFIAAPETFSRPMAAAAPPVDDIKDPAERQIAAHGRYLVTTGACYDCHQVPTAQGPDASRYLAGGLRFHNDAGTFVTANLTPDKTTGLGRRTDDQVKRLLRSGVTANGRVDSYRLMPWGAFSHYTDEDLHAIVVYLRHLKPVRHEIPDPALGSTPPPGGAVEQVFGGADYGK